MIKQKHGFWLFLFSLIPGAGEMYMGFKKQGISIMLLFLSVFALGASTGMDWIVVFFPVIWFYSFFNVHNLKSLSPDEFYSLEDSYILHLDHVFGNTDSFLNKYRTLTGILLLVFGFSILWNNFSDILSWILPDYMASVVNAITYQLPQIIIAIAILFAGFYLLSNKKKELGQEEKKTGEHFWEPYRPYQQPVHSTTSAATAATAPVTTTPAATAPVDSAAPFHMAASEHPNNSMAPAESNPTVSSVQEG